MDKYRGILRKRLITAGVYCLIILLLAVIEIIIGKEQRISEHILKFNIGFCIGILGSIIFDMAKYIVALKDESKLKKLYINENDERNKYINAKIGSSGMRIMLAVLAGCTVISGFINMTIFITLFCVLVFSILMIFILKLYYNKRING